MREKDILRKQIRALKQAHSPQEMSLLSEGITESVLSLPEVRAAHTLLLYNSISGEVSTAWLISRLLGQGKDVLLPVVTGSETMELRRYTGLEPMSESSFHIMEPEGEAFTDYAGIDVAIVPGLAFTPDGRRLGRGKGYYDRMLKLLGSTYKIGVCFPFQLVAGIPTGRYDVAMDTVIWR